MSTYSTVQSNGLIPTQTDLLKMDALPRYARLHALYCIRDARLCWTDGGSHRTYLHSPKSLAQGHHPPRRKMPPKITDIEVRQAGIKRWKRGQRLDAKRGSSHSISDDIKASKLERTQAFGIPTSLVSLSLTKNVSKQLKSKSTRSIVFSTLASMFDQTVPRRSSRISPS